MIASLKGLDWRGFLARPTLPASSPQLHHKISHQPILITGAGGSIGSALALRLAQFALPGLILLESAENRLCQLEQAFIKMLQASSGAVTPVTFVLGDAGSRAILEELFTAYGPRLVFHAAAHKHVPLLEEQPFAAIANNIFVTETVAELAASHGARVVLLSTDKAVAPSSVMGATKRVAEELVLRNGGTVLRLGNVLASSGSVAEVFAHQIACGRPLTVTDPAACRYFLTMDEAVNLLLLAAAQPSSSTLWAPALPEAHRIVELAHFMAGVLAPGREIPIEFTGLRPGDKLRESLWEDAEVARTSANGDLLSIQSSRPAPVPFQRGLAALRTALAERSLCTAIDQLCALVPGYSPSQFVLALARRAGEGVRV